MQRKEASTQAELDTIVAAGDIAIVRLGYFCVRESSHVVARGSSHVEAWGSSHVVASKYVSVAIFQDKKGKVIGGIQIVPDYSTVKKWLDYQGVPVAKDRAVVLYKAVTDTFHSGHGFLYTPGTTTTAPDWDGEKRECGGGLHLCPSPAQAKVFHPEATKFLACTVAVEDLALGPMPLQYPNKIKARHIGKIVEVDYFTGNARKEQHADG